jgi:hypothetical protein
MNKNLYLLLLLAFIPLWGSAQYIPDMLADDINPPDTATTFSLRSSRAGSAENFYNNLNNWIPYGILAPNEPLKNPPLKIIEIAFHLFLDDQGGNCAYLNNDQGRNRLIWAFNLLNKIYAGYEEHENNFQKGSSDPVPGLIELPDCDTRIRFSLGDNNERIYFYNNSNLNANASKSKLFTDFLRDNFPERTHTLNVFFSAGTYGTAGGYVDDLADDDLSINHHVVICQSHKLTNDWILGSLLAHEIGHNLGLVHTYCYGGASVICCSGSSCYQGCTKTTDTSDYLSDIFGPITNSTCPHIANWGDPFDNTIPNAEKITNSIMGGSFAGRYVSPMQAGMMHRSLALKSVRKYVKKETYASVPLVIDNSEIWDFDLKLYRDIVISSGAVLTLAKTFDFPYNGTVTVNNGAALVIEKNANLSNNNKIIVKNGGTLRFLSGSSTKVEANGYIDIQPGAYICVEPGANIHLQDTSSVISIRPDAHLGANPALFSNASCQSIISYTGNGKVDLPIKGNNSINCRETTFSINIDIPEATYSWSVSPNIQIVSGQNTPTLKVKGLSYNASNSWIEVNVTHNGQSYTATKQVAVNIPLGFDLVLGKPKETADGKIAVEIRARPYPEGVKATSCVYDWNATGGSLCVGCAYKYEAGYLMHDYPPFVLQLMNIATLQAQSEVINGDTIKIRPIAKATSNRSSAKSAVLEVKTISEEETKTEYVSVETDETFISSLEQISYYNPYLHELGEVEYSLFSWNFAHLTYTPGSNVTVHCHITGCNTNYSATLIIASCPYTVSYTPSVRSIRFAKDSSLPSDGNVHTYQVQLFNDSGYIRTDTFTSNEETILIPLNTLPNGNYYINVLDEQGNIAVRKLIPVY